MNKKRDLPCVARQISATGLIAMLYAIILVLNEAPDATLAVSLMVYSIVIYYINRLFARKPRQIGHIVLLNLICAVVVFAAFIISGTVPLFWQAAYSFISLVIITGLGAAGAFGSMKLNSILLFMDANILLMIFAILVIMSRNASFSWTAFSIVGAVAGLLGTISFRTDRPLGKREWGTILFLFAVIAIIAWLLFTFVVSPLSAGARGLGEGAASLFVFIWNQIERFFRFLASLWHDDGSQAELPEMLPASQTSGEDMTGSVQENGIMPVLVIGIIVVAVLIILIHIFRRSKKTKIRNSFSAGAASTEAVKSTPFADALKKLFAKIKRRFNSGYYMRTHKDSAEGIYFSLVKACRHTELEKCAGDTPAEFLMRIRSALSEENRSSAGYAEEGNSTFYFDELIPAVNESFYSSGNSEQTFSWAKSVVSEVKKTARRRSRAAGSKSEIMNSEELQP